jgi:pimeloyl-ACP methyl ester carboxylesterase
MRRIDDALSPGQRAENLLVLLPPALSKLEDLLEQGFVAEVRGRGLPLDIVLAEPCYQQVMGKTVAEDLHQEVVMPALSAGYRRIWLAGVSLGAFNALTYAAVYGECVAGMKLIAPYPGTSDILHEIQAAGGPEAWAADPASSHADERAWWHWLAHAGRFCQPEIYLGLASQDRFHSGQAMMAGLVPAERVHRVEGDHSWPVWQALWRHWLDQGQGAWQ